ncbi:VOC family protein [Mucilaginibacter pocheonensis]|uniref:Enzyme related to lactoylglutathione lyase n=1 Tax=Mucilaginibacter pocheonensis TaxID=398050 RepID=A0ABU1TFD0_9SPHI|nr:VOC family protein [Mucilaginibacter pocheonensis]MDR6943561.1 putative enzyme related to lactoylglutathione lyase [Mucilaginibacter pocheonensis]
MLKDNKTFSSFSVNDLARAREFYGKTLGLNIHDDEKMPNLLNLEINKDNVILIYPKPNHVPATFTILNFNVQNVEQTVDELTSRGVKFIIYNDENFKTNEKGILAGNDQGPTIAWFNDPAGNILSVIQSGN